MIFDVNSKKPSAALWFAFFILVFSFVSLNLSTDATPDFKITHHYVGYAFLNARDKIDIFPAGYHTRFYYGVDVFYYFIFMKLNNHPKIINIILSLPYAACAFCIFLIARRFVELQGWWRDVVSASAGVIGLTGASALPTIATSMTDILPGLPYVAALTFWVRKEIDGRNTLATTAFAGFVAGLSVGMKLTQTPLFVALFMAIALRQFLGRRTAWQEAFIFGLCGLLAFSLLSGPWLWSNYASTGNPLFPLMNNLFKSDLIAHGSYADTRFFPRTWKMALFYPAYWTFMVSHFAIELDMRDARILVGCVSSLLIVIAFLTRLLIWGRSYQPSPLRLTGFYLATIYLISYLLWLNIWSIYRYLAIQECLSAVMLLIALREVFGSLLAPRAQAAIYAPLALAIGITTVYPQWGRAQPADVAVRVEVPALERDAMMLVLDPYAHSYVVPHLTPSVPVVGARTNINGPGNPGQLQARVEAAIAAHKGPLWGMDFPAGFPGVADETLKAYNLKRGAECSMVVTNIEDKPTIRICRLERS